jgi:superfamily II RNA helicase
MNPDNIKKEHITKKGIMASQINECNEILFPEIIMNDIFKELNVLEVIGILSMFIKTKPLDEEYLVYDHHTLNISKKMKESIDKMFNISENLYQMEQNYQIKLETDWDLNLNMIVPSMIWASGKLFSEIYYDNFEGNFIKDMIKIGNISKDLEVMAEFLGKLELMAKCSRIESLVVRDMVTIDSLYIKN